MVAVVLPPFCVTAAFWMLRVGRAYSGIVNGAFTESHEPPFRWLPDVTTIPVRESVLIHISQLPFFT